MSPGDSRLVKENGMRRTRAKARDLEFGHLRGFLEQKLPSLAKAGWLRPLRKSGEASLAGADGVVRSSTDDWKLNEPPRPRQSKERDHLLDGASTPLCQGGEVGLTCCLSAGRGRNAKFEMYVQVY